MEPVHTVKRPFLTITVYPNRVQIKDRRGFLFLAREKTILNRNISSVNARGATETLEIQTNDGKTHKWNLGGGGGTARGVADAILNHL